MAHYSLTDYLKLNPMFANLDSYSFEVIEGHLAFKSLEAGDILFNEGDIGDYVAIVVAGKLEIIKKVHHYHPPTNTSPPLADHSHSDGHECTQACTTTRLATMKVGDSIGEMAVIDQLSRSATVRALETTGLITLPKKDFDIILQDHPRIGINILKGIATILSLNLRRTSDSLSKERH